MVVMGEGGGVVGVSCNIGGQVLVQTWGREGGRGSGGMSQKSLRNVYALVYFNIIYTIPYLQSFLNNNINTLIN